MKKANQSLNSIFTIAEEMKPNNGEDAFYFEAVGNRFVVASFDGCGGSGSKKYANYSGKTGAYIASRAVCGGVKSWFNNSGKDGEMAEYINKALDVCKQYADRGGRIMGSLGKAFPTTAAVIAGQADHGKVEATCYWAGDSRCYMLDEAGLHQLTVDDLDGQDAMSNLSNDGVMTNVINATSPFDIHVNKLKIDHPCILFTATDGCFGYLNSPMEFEYLITSSLVDAKNITQWKILMNEKMNAIAGDDYTLTVAVCGFEDKFESIRSTYVQRNSFLENEYINSQRDVNELWEAYKKDYSMYL